MTANISSTPIIKDLMSTPNPNVWEGIVIGIIIILICIAILIYFKKRNKPVIEVITEPHVILDPYNPDEELEYTDLGEEILNETQPVKKIEVLICNDDGTNCPVCDDNPCNLINDMIITEVEEVGKTHIVPSEQTFAKNLIAKKTTDKIEFIEGADATFVFHEHDVPVTEQVTEPVTEQVEPHKMYPCAKCGREFKSKLGLKNHKKRCAFGKGKK